MFQLIVAAVSIMIVSALCVASIHMGDTVVHPDRYDDRKDFVTGGGL